MRIIIIITAKNMDFEKYRIRTCLLYEFQLGHSAALAHRNVVTVFGQESPSERTCRDWFAKFKSGDFSLEDNERSGRPPELNDEALLELVKSNSRLSTTEMATTLRSSHATISRHLLVLGFKQKYGKWLPHQLTDDQRETRVTICTSLLTRRRTTQWLRNVITGDEKWVLYINHSRKRQWVQAGERALPDESPGPHPKKIMLSIFWDYKGVIWYELLDGDTRINGHIYRLQLQRLKAKLKEMRPDRGRVILLHDNAKPHTAIKTRNRLTNYKWEVLPHPPYSPDLAPSDYHLFLSLSSFLKEKVYDDKEHLKNDLDTFFTSKPEEFYARGIFMLPERWAQVVELDGHYID